MDTWYRKQNVHTLRGAEYRNLRQVLGSRIAIGDYQDDPRLLSYNTYWPQWTYNGATNQCVPCTWLPAGQQWRCDGFRNLLDCQARNGLPLNVNDVPRAYTCTCDFGCIACRQSGTNFSEVNACSEFPSQQQCGSGCCGGVPNAFQAAGVNERGRQTVLTFPCP